jgi:hypothetical protein
MKKISVLICCVSIVSMGAFAQGSYVRFNVGYGMPLGSQQVGSDQTYNSNTEEETEKGIYGSYGSGLYIQAAYGVSLKGIVGLDFEVGYLAGKKYESKLTTIGFDVNGTMVTKANGFSFAPSITFTAQDGNIIPYSRVGPVIGLYKIISETDLDIFGSDLAYEEEYTGGLAFGFKGSVGVIFNPASKWQFFSEINFITMSYSPKKGEVKKFTIDGESMLDDFSSEERNFKFKDSITTDGEQESNDRVKESLPFGSISIQAGIRFKIN